VPRADGRARLARGADPASASRSVERAVPAVPWLRRDVARRRRTPISAGGRRGGRPGDHPSTRPPAARPRCRSLPDARPAVAARPGFALKGILRAMTLAAGAGIRAAGAPRSAAAVGSFRAAALALAAAVAGARGFRVLSGLTRSGRHGAVGSVRPGAAGRRGRGAVRARPAARRHRLGDRDGRGPVASPRGAQRALWLPATLGPIASVAFALPRSSCRRTSRRAPRFRSPSRRGFGLSLPAAAPAARARRGAPWRRRPAEPLPRAHVASRSCWVAPAIGVATSSGCNLLALHDGFPVNRLRCGGSVGSTRSPNAVCRRVGADDLVGSTA
jgi:hypothetical protein